MGHAMTVSRPACCQTHQVILILPMIIFRYCFPFGRPEGALKATLSLLERVSIIGYGLMIKCGWLIFTVPISVLEERLVVSKF